MMLGNDGTAGAGAGLKRGAAGAGGGAICGVLRGKEGCVRFGITRGVAGITGLAGTTGVMEGTVGLITGTTPGE